jgi:hypothetical protein
VAVAGQTPTRLHLIDSDSVTWEVIGSAYPDPNDPTKLVRDVKAHAKPTIASVPATANPGPFQIAHGLGRVPNAVSIVMTSDAIIRLQTPTKYDATYVYLSASDSGVTCDLLLW